MKFSGIVKKHLGRGKELGFPTANIDAPQEIEDGIYAGVVHFNTRPYYSIVFIGANQTFDEAERRAEVYILDFDEDLYGQEIEVELVKRIRGVVKFDSAEELVVQMQEDERVAREYFRSIDANIRMDANYTNKHERFVHGELSYKLNGILFAVHNKLDRYAREKQYCDLIEEMLKERGLAYKREFVVGDTGNILDFVIENKVILEIKAKRLVLKEDFYQAQRYLQSTGLDLCLIVNFRNRFLKPIRVLRIKK